VSTGEAQIAARALYDVVTRGMLKGLRDADAVRAALGDGASATQVLAALPAGVAPEVRNLVASLAQGDALDQLPAVVRSFEGLVGGSAQRALEGEVTSAVALDGAQQARILADLTQRYGDRIVVRFSVDESLIGGLIVRMGDRVLDNSLRTRLAALQRNMIVG
jgi:F-type H+-transporting ATPase subunit delta